jgi:protein TIF31
VFNPQPASDHCFAHSLVDTLKQLSPSFKRNFELLLRKRNQKMPLERVPTSTQLYSWLSPRIEHTPDSLRAEDGTNTNTANCLYRTGRCCVKRATI